MSKTPKASAPAALDLDAVLGILIQAAEKKGWLAGCKHLRIVRNQVVKLDWEFKKLVVIHNKLRAELEALKGEAVPPIPYQLTPQREEKWREFFIDQGVEWGESYNITKRCHTWHGENIAMFDPPVVGKI